MFYFNLADVALTSSNNPCGDEGPDEVSDGKRYRCTRELGHSHWHAAHGPTIDDRRLDKRPGDYRYVLAIWGGNAHAQHPHYDESDMAEAGDDDQQMAFNIMFPSWDGMDVHSAGHFLENIAQAWIALPNSVNRPISIGTSIGAAVGAAGSDDFLPIIVTTTIPTPEEVEMVNSIYEQTPTAKLVDSAFYDDESRS